MIYDLALTVRQCGLAEDLITWEIIYYNMLAIIDRTIGKDSVSLECILVLGVSHADGNVLSLFVFVDTSKFSCNWSLNIGVPTMLYEGINYLN